jgi:hypothetical protein
MTGWKDRRFFDGMEVVDLVRRRLVFVDTERESMSLLDLLRWREAPKRTKTTAMLSWNGYRMYHVVRIILLCGVVMSR